MLSLSLPFYYFWALPTLYPLLFFLKEVKEPSFSLILLIPFIRLFFPISAASANIQTIYQSSVGHSLMAIEILP